MTILTQMYPALWAGYDQRVVRAEWFYVGSDGSCLPIHCDTILDKDIKHAYKQAAPWRLQERLRGTLQRPKLDEDKWYDLPNVTGGVKVQFESMHVARVTSRNFSTQIFPFLRESYLVRGFQNATALFDKVNSASLLSKWPRATETAPTGKSPPTMAAIDTTKPAHEADHTAKGNAVPPEGAEAATAPDGRTLDWDATLPSTKDTNTSVADESDGPGASCRGTDGPDLEALRSEAELAEATASDAPPGEAHNGSSAAASEEGPTEAHNAPRSTSRRHRLLRPDGKAQMALDAAAPWVALSEAFISRALSFRSQRLRAQPDVDTSPRAAEMPTAVQDESAPSPTPAPADLYDDDTSMPSTSMQPPQLLFCIHGIGQKLSEDYASMHFVHDIDRLRSIMREQLDDPDLRQLLNGGRVKLVPICWRRDLQFDPEEEHYTLQDLVNHAMLPAVRTVMTKVLLDVPFYFSRHHDRMERQVLKEMNRLYRLFVQRNPEFEARGGTVSVLAHSLGAMLAGDILTRQPTEVPPLRDVDGPRIHLTSDHLLFNVDKFFCVGSPLPIVLYMAGARLVARKRHDDDNDDATLDAVGKTGCMAMRSIYNVRRPDSHADLHGRGPA